MGDLEVVTHHCSDLPHILPTQSTTLDLPHFPVTDISAVIIISSSHTVSKSYHCTFFGQSLEHILLRIIQQGVPSHQEVLLYIFWIVSQASTARDYLARSTKSSRSIIIVHSLDSLSSIYCQGLFSKEYHSHQEVLSLYILWIVSRAFTARDYFARSTTVSKFYYIVCLVVVCLVFWYCF